jgi:hypothetical protein
LFIKTLALELDPDLDPNLDPDPDAVFKTMRIHNPVQITSELK